MKLRIKKFLAGLLSFGILLQAASPLSALAAASSTAAAPGLTVTVDSVAYDLTVDSNGQVTVPNDWTASGLPTVSYNPDTTTYTLTGRLGNSATGAVAFSGTGNPNLTLQNDNAGVVWAGQLDVTGVNDFKASTESNSSAISFNIISGCERNATIDCTGDIEISAKDGNAVYHGALVVKNAQDVTVKSTGSSSTLSNQATINCSGDIRILNTGTGEAAEVGLTVNGAASVELSSSNSDRTAGSLNVKNCSGSVEVTNSGTGRAVYSTLNVGDSNNYTASSVTINGGIGTSTDTYCNGDITINGTLYKVDEYGHTFSSHLMSENGFVTVDGGTKDVPYLVNGTTYVKGKQVTLKGNASTKISNGYGKDIEAETKVLIVENTGSGSVGRVKFTAEKGTDYDIYLDADHTQQSDVSLSDLNGSTDISSKYLYVAAKDATPDNAELKITVGGEEYRIDPKDVSEYGKEYIIGYNVFTVQYLSYADEYDIYGTVPDGTQIEGIGTHRPALRMMASTADGIAHPITYGSLTIKNMGNVNLDGVIDGNLTIKNVKDVSSGVVGYAGSGNLIIDGAENVKYLTHVFGTIDINCTGEVNIYGSRDGSISDGADITAKSLMMKFVSINGSVGNVGSVKFTRTDTTSDYRILTGKNADNITSQTAMTGSTFDQTVEETYLCIEPGTPHEHTAGTEWKSDGTYHWHTCTTCDEDVQLDKAEHDFGEDGNAKTCAVCGAANPNYKEPQQTDQPEHQHTAGTEWESDGTYHWHACATCDEDVQLNKAPHDFGEDGSAKTCAECGYANPNYKEPEPDTPDTPDVPDDTGDSGSAVGAVVAGAAIGGTALFVGYEVVTDAILSNLLPKGADTPVNRGQLAWLIWGTKDAPEPEHQPAFTDVSDPEMAKAAQWCVEQGLMDAKSDTTFAPNGWTPKFRVIETWNRAFPKN